jgi:6-phosphogluconolactonase (cycloisomerase 2 family)
MLKDGVNGVDGLEGSWAVTLSSDGKHVYVTGEVDDAVSWFGRNASTGALAYGGMLKDGVNGVDGLNRTRGMTFSSDGKHAYVTGENDNAVSWYERNASTGALTYGGMLKDGVNGVDGLEGSWAVTFSSDGKHAYVTGENDNAVSWYERNASTGALTYGGMLKDGVNGVDGLEGSWAVTLSSDGKHVYVTGEVDDAVSWFGRNASTGALAYGGMLKDGVNGVDGLNRTRGMTFSSDGKHAYVTGENDNAVSWYERNASTGALTYGGMLKDGVNGVDGLEGSWAVTFSSDGKHAYVTGENDNAVSWYERNASTGALTYGGMLKDGVNGVDGLNRAYGITFSSDGLHAYVTVMTAPTSA